MIVYNPIEYDGRVQRTIKSLEISHKINLFCPRLTEMRKSVFSKTFVNHSFFQWKSLNNKLFLLLFLIEALLHFKKKKHNIIYIHDFYPIILSFFFKIILDKKVVYDMHELIVPQTNHIKLKNIFYYIEKFAIKYVDFIVIPSFHRSQFIKSHYNLDKTPFVFQNITKPESTNDENPIFNIINSISKSKISIIYIGDISLSRGLLDVVKGFEMLDNSFELYLIGDGPGEATIRKKAIYNKNIHYYRAIPSRNIHSLLKHFDIGIVTYSMNGINNQLCAPNKTFDYAHCNLPIVTSGQKPLVSLLNKYKIGYCINENTENRPLEFKKGMIYVAQNLTNLRTNLPKFISDFSYENELLKLNQEISSKYESEIFN